MYDKNSYCKNIISIYNIHNSLDNANLIERDIEPDKNGLMHHGLSIETADDLLSAVFIVL